MTDISERLGLDYLKGIPSKNGSTVKELSTIFDVVAKLADDVADVETKIALKAIAARGKEKLKKLEA